MNVIRVQTGQVWAPQETWRTSRITVLGVDRALVLTDAGRRTVFDLLRNYRLVQAASGEQVAA